MRGNLIYIFSEGANITGYLIVYSSLVIPTLQRALLDKIEGQHFSFKLILNPNIVALNLTIHIIVIERVSD